MRPRVAECRGCVTLAPGWPLTMLDAFIIEEIQRRERVRREELDRPIVELPVPSPEDEVDQEERRQPVRRGNTDEGEEKPGRGVVVIDLYPS